jgi:hypothetical protein
MKKEIFSQVQLCPHIHVPGMHAMSELTMITKYMMYICVCVCVCVCVSTATDVLMNGTLCDNLFERLQEIGLATPI